MLAVSGAVVGVACSSFSANDPAPGDGGSPADVASDAIGTFDANLADATPRRCTTVMPDAGVCFDFDTVSAPGQGWRSGSATNGSIAFDPARSVSPGQSVQFRTDPAEVSDGGGSVFLLTSQFFGNPGQFALGVQVFPGVYEPPDKATALAVFTFAAVELGVAIYVDWSRGSSGCNVRMVAGTTPKDGKTQNREVALGVIPMDAWSRLQVSSRLEGGNAVLTASVGASPIAEVRLPFDGTLEERYLWLGSAPQGTSPRGMTLNFDDVSLEPMP
jgi:hypothetical protein